MKRTLCSTINILMLLILAEIMVELHDAITQIGRHFISSDQNFIKVNLEPDFSKESHGKDFERFTQGYNMNGYKRAKALVGK